MSPTLLWHLPNMYVKFITVYSRREFLRRSSGRKEGLTPIRPTSPDQPCRRAYFHEIWLEGIHCPHSLHPSAPT